MKQFIIIFWFTCIHLMAYSQMVPESMVKAFANGDSKKIAEYFHDNLEMKILEDVHITSKNQATRILQVFFKDYPPTSFKVTYEGTKQDSKYGIGTLATKKGNFRVNLYFMEGRKEKIIYYLSIEKL